MRKILLVALLLSTFIIVVLNLTFGTYFEKYEPLLNALTTGEFTSPIPFSFFISSWFYIFPFFSLFNTFFNSTYGYSWITTILNTVILCSLLSCLYVLVKREHVRTSFALVIFLLFGLIYVENLVYIQNLRISFFFIVAAYLQVFVIKRYRLSKWYYFIALFFGLAGVLSRLEIAVITSVVLLVYSLLFQRQLLRFSVLLLFLAVSVFAFYKIYQHNLHPDQETILQVEHVFEDRQSIDPDEAKDRRTQLLLKAIWTCMRDDDVYTIDDVARIVFRQSMSDYIRSEKFPVIYFQKLEELVSLLKGYLWLLALTIILSFYTSFIYLKHQSKHFIALLKIAALITFLISLILLLNAVIICPHNLIVVLWISVCILCFVYLMLKANEHKSISRFCFIFLIAFQTPLTGYYLYQLHIQEELRGEKARIFRSMLENLNQQKKIIVFAGGTNEEDNPARLFSRLYKTKINHYYADFFLNRYSCYIKHTEEFFGAGYPLMKSKMAAIANHPEVAYLSNESTNKFVAEYMMVFHHVKLNFAEINTEVTPTGWKPYSVYETKSDVSSTAD